MRVRRAFLDDDSIEFPQRLDFLRTGQDKLNQRTILQFGFDRELHAMGYRRWPTYAKASEGRSPEASAAGDRLMDDGS